MSERITSSGISFYDCSDYIRRIRSTYSGSCEVLLYVPMRSDSRYALDVRVRFIRESSGGDGARYERGVSGAFPSVRARTMAGLVLQLLMELDNKLEEERGEAERRTRRSFAGF